MPRFSNRLLPYVLLSPSLLIILVFLIYPSLDTLRLAFYRVSPFGERRIYVALANYTGLVSDPDYLNSIVVSILFTAFVVLVGLTVSLAIALLLNRRVAGFSLYRALLIWPYALSPAIAGVLWGFFFDPNVGPIPRLLFYSTGIDLNWQTDTTLALLLIAVAATWKMLGYNIVFFLVALQMVPKDMLDAAAIDGAGAWARFRRIVFPLMAPITFFLVITNTLYAFFDVFGLLHVTTQGGPGRATELLIYKLYRDGFQSLRVGYASTQSVLLIVLVGVITVLQFRYARQRVHYQ